MKAYQVFLLIILLGISTCDALSCSTTTRTTKGNLHYPGYLGLDCPAATISAQSALTSYHYRKACQNAFGLPSLPASVSQVEVIDCFEAPAPGWSDGTVIEVEICCKFQGWTAWLDRDNPSGSGDYEDIATFLTLGQACSSPYAIECRRISDQTDAALTGQNILCQTSYGFRCINNQQPDGKCHDYQVRFVCP